jgi:hypothetical protein
MNMRRAMGFAAAIVPLGIADIVWRISNACRGTARRAKCEENDGGSSRRNSGSSTFDD